MASITWHQIDVGSSTSTVKSCIASNLNWRVPIAEREEAGQPEKAGKHLIDEDSL